MSGKYRVRVFMVGIDPERAKDLREVLGRVVKGAGKQSLRDLMRKAHQGDRVLIYETNDDDNAQEVKRIVEGGGATVEIDGLRPPEPLF